MFQKGNQYGKLGAGVSKKKYEAFQRIEGFVLNDGADALVEVLRDLRKKDPEKFVTFYIAVLEYFRPKMSRAEVNNEGSIDINIVTSKP